MRIDVEPNAAAVNAEFRVAADPTEQRADSRHPAAHLLAIDADSRNFHGEATRSSADDFAVIR